VLVQQNAFPPAGGPPFLEVVDQRGYFVIGICIKYFSKKLICVHVVIVTFLLFQGFPLSGSSLYLTGFLFHPFDRIHRSIVRLKNGLESRNPAGGPLFSEVC